MSERRALLLTDVVDSTRLSETIGDAAMAALWTAHDRLARDLLPHWRGREIDKTDGMLLMFDEVADAVHYAAAYHAALAQLPHAIAARAGVHIGPVTLRENSADDVALGAKPLEVDGLAKPTVARIMGVALGGQTLLSADAQAALAGTALQGGLQLSSHGHWALKGLSEPIELFEAGGEHCAFTTPPDGEKAHRVVRLGDQWRPVFETPNNLPAQVTSFVGREREVREVKAQLESFRLVTLLGMGGLGKTRLSLRVATELLAQFPDGVWFLDLAPIRDEALVLSEAAQVLDVREEPDHPLLRTLCTALKARKLLLIFDNCEHLVKASAELANAILRAAPQVRILASSREALRVPGECSYPVLPLPVPSGQEALEVLARFTAVRLFVDRARLHKPSFELNEREAPAVAELVARLEGIPLALELAAARVRALSLAGINERLKDRYKLLTGGGRVLLPRQQTLRALVDWSYELLEPEQRVLFNRLSVFVGGFDLEAAEAVCGEPPLQADDVMELLSSLVEESLVMTSEHEGGMRYKMLETIRDYASEKLALEADLAATAARHCNHYFAVAKAARGGLKGPEQALWIQRMETDLDNVRAATALALSGGVDAFIAVKIAIAMMSFWMLRGYSTEGRQVVHDALALPAIQASEVAQAHALYVGAALAGSQSDHGEAQVMLEACLELRRRLGNPVEVAATLSTLALAHLQAGEPERAAASECEALAIFQERSDLLGQALSQLHLGQIAVYVGDEALALTHLRECLRLEEGLKNREIEGEAELALGERAVNAGRWDEAGQHIRSSLEVCREAHDRRGEALALWWLARLALLGDAPGSAAAGLNAALRTFREFEMREALAECLEDQGELALHEGQSALGVRLMSAAEEFRERLDLKRSPADLKRWQTRQLAMHQALSDEAFSAAWDAGRALGLPGALLEAQALCAAAAPASSSAPGQLAALSTG
jgi:predicted ATPase/class 3 adenylate cyclase